MMLALAASVLAAIAIGYFYGSLTLAMGVSGGLLAIASTLYWGRVAAPHRAMC